MSKPLATALTGDLKKMRIMYFIFFAGNGIFFTFINVYYVELGLTGMQIGIINTLSPLAGVIGMTLWGLLNDRSGKTRHLLIAAIAGSAVSALMLGQAHTFLTVLPLAVIYAFFANPIIPLIDSTTLSLLGQHPEDYGRQRLFGSVGFIVSTMSIGVILQRNGVQWMFPLFALVWCALLAGATRLPVAQIRLGGFSLRGLNRMVRQPSWVVFTASVFMLGLAFSGLFNFLSVTLRMEGASESLIGLSWTMAAVSEIPIMFFGPALLARVGAPRLLAISYLFYAVRAVMYAVMPNPMWAVPINALFGAAYGLYWISAVGYTSQIAPPGLRTTTQSLLTSTTSLATMIGAFFSGWLFDAVGPDGLFFALAGCCLSAFVILAGGRLLLRRHGAAAIAN
jgi:MFS transporter, PPP family, 3-phenylpropionic acid transporter